MKIKIRLEGLHYDWSGDYTPTYIYNNEKYYFIGSFKKLYNINWLNDDEILNNLPEYNINMMELYDSIEIDLSKDEFIEKYLIKIDSGEYILYKELLNNYDDYIKAGDTILLLAQIKYELIVKLGMVVKILEINIEEIN